MEVGEWVDQVEIKQTQLFFGSTIFGTGISRSNLMTIQTILVTPWAILAIAKLIYIDLTYRTAKM